MYLLPVFIIKVEFVNESLFDMMSKSQGKSGCSKISLKGNFLLKIAQFQGKVRKLDTMLIVKSSRLLKISQSQDPYSNLGRTSKGKFGEELKVLKSNDLSEANVSIVWVSIYWDDKNQFWYDKKNEVVEVST
jgi:hypothetical protein